jgi:hypothetical protein
VRITNFAFVACLLTMSLMTAGGADAAVTIGPVVEANPDIATIADGCGGGRYRGPGGACHWYGRGPYPGGYHGPYGHSYPVNHGCGAGRYRGPYGSCHRFGTGPYPQGYFGPTTAEVVATDEA